MEVGAERVGVLIDSIEVGTFAEFGASEAHTCPGCVNVDPEGVKSLGY